MNTNFGIGTLAASAYPSGRFPGRESKRLPRACSLKRHRIGADGEAGKGGKGLTTGMWMPFAPPATVSLGKSVYQCRELAKGRMRPGTVPGLVDRMPKIVISYRRSDTQAIAGRIYDRLVTHYGDESVFMDIDKIPIGTDFRQYIRDELRTADLFLAVIGPRWLGPRDDGRLRINDRADPVRVEIETALENGMPVIPVLVDGASMPPEEVLPDALKDFAFINAAMVDIGRDYRQHMERLIRGLDAILAARSAKAAATLSPAPVMAQAPAPVVPQPEPAIPEAPPSPPVASPQVPTSAKPAYDAPARPSALADNEASAATASVKTGTHSRRLAVWGSVLAIGVVAVGWYATTELGSPAKTSPSAALPPPPSSSVERPPVPERVTAPPAAPEKAVGSPAPIPRPPIDAKLAPTIRWRLQTAFGVNQSTSMSSLAKQVGALSKGRMTVQIFSSGQLVPAFEILDAVANGVLELGYAPGSYWVGKSKAFALMSSIPFGFAPRDQLRFRHRADVSSAFGQLLSPRGVVALPCGTFGRPGEMWLRRSLTTAGDLRGLKLRVAGIEADIYRELGATTVLLPGTETYAALERGVIDGARLLSPKADLDLGFPQIARFYYHPGLLTPSVVVDLLINRQKWESLPETGRAILTRACLDATDAMLEDNERSDREALAEIARRGVTVNPVPVQVARAMLAASQKVLGNLGRSDRTVSAVMSIVEQVRPTTIAAQLR